MSYKKMAAGGRATARKRYADGGLVEALRDSQDDAKGALEDKMHALQNAHRPGQFWDYGMTVPGRQSAKNLEWERKRGIKSRMIKD